jgi:hypothetical protein
MRILQVLIGVLYAVGFFVGLCSVTYCIDGWLLGGQMEGYAMNEFLRMPVWLVMACLVGAAGAYFHSNNVGTACAICRWGGLTLLVGICAYVCWLDWLTQDPILDIGDIGFMWGECIVAAILMMCAPRAIEWWDWRRLRAKGWIMPVQDPGAWPPAPAVKGQSQNIENLSRESVSKHGPRRPMRRRDGDVLGRGDGREHPLHEAREDADSGRRPPG